MCFVCVCVCVKNYSLLVTGHSLGAGTAVILACKLRRTYPDVRCIAYSPPGGLISKALADYTKTFVMSVVVGDDIVPRLSIISVHNLKADILREIHNTSLPKYCLFWRYTLGYFNRSATSSSVIANTSNHNFVELSANQITIATTTNTISNGDEYTKNETFASSQTDISSNDKQISSEQPHEQQQQRPVQLRRADSVVQLIDEIKSGENATGRAMASIFAYRQIKQMLRNVYATYPELQLPGNILYIYKVNH